MTKQDRLAARCRQRSWACSWRSGRFRDDDAGWQKLRALKRCPRCGSDVDYIVLLPTAASNVTPHTPKPKRPKVKR